MRGADYRRLILIFVIAVVAIWVSLPTNPGIHVNLFGQRIDYDIRVYQGLDLQGGVQVTLQADVPAGETVPSDKMQAAKAIIERRVNALGVAEPLIQLAEPNRIIVELPGVSDPDAAVRTFGETGLLEVIDTGSVGLPVGMEVTTSLGGPRESSAEGSASPAATPTPGTNESTAPTTPAPDPTVYPTVLQGTHFASSDVTFDQLGRPQISFSLTGEGTELFRDHTTQNVGRYLSITMDKRVISSASIRQPITQGQGVIEGNFPLEEARGIVVQLKYGSLPVALKVVQNRTVGPTLGQDSLQKSSVAGAIGLGIVAAFMLLYYRLPGLLADVALIIYAALVFALFKLIPVTLTLAGIAGFILSIGMAVDANILIFERMKEELRAGRTLRAAIDAGFDRAWTSIRDTNVSTLITCAILFWFGMQFGASIIQGFALTLAIGVIVSLFSAIFVSRTFLRILVSSGIVRDLWWYGYFGRRADPSPTP